jgi:hypothetical protein
MCGKLSIKHPLRTLGIKKKNGADSGAPTLTQAEQDQAAIEQQAASEANLAIAANRRRRRLGSLLGAGRTVLGAPAGGGAPSGAGTALSGGGGSAGGGTALSGGGGYGGFKGYGGSGYTY